MVVEYDKLSGPEAISKYKLSSELGWRLQIRNECGFCEQLLGRLFIPRRIIRNPVLY